MYLFCNSRIHVITLHSGHVCVYYASMVRCWHLVWILVRIDHPCLGVGCHKPADLLTLILSFVYPYPLMRTFCSRSASSCCTVSPALGRSCCPAPPMLPRSSSYGRAAPTAALDRSFAELLHGGPCGPALLQQWPRRPVP
jgi:hypothetical protein